MPVNNKGEKVFFKEGWRIVFFLNERTFSLTDEQGSRARLGNDDKLWWETLTAVMCADFAKLLALCHDLQYHFQEDESSEDKLVFLFTD